MADLRYTLRSFGALLDGPAWLFRDNKLVVTSSTIPHSTLSKRWNALSYHRVREAIASGWLRFEHMAGTENPADILTKPLPWFTLRIFVEPFLMWKGDTDDAPSGSTNPEGSDANPGTARTRESSSPAETREFPGASNETQRHHDTSHAGQEIPRELANNQYAVLYDENG